MTRVMCMINLFPILGKHGQKILQLHRHWLHKKEGADIWNTVVRLCVIDVSCILLFSCGFHEKSSLETIGWKLEAGDGFLYVLLWISNPYHDEESTQLLSFNMRMKISFEI